MEYVVGVLLGLVVGGFASGLGFERDRSFYPTVLVVIAFYYVLFAVMGEPREPALPIEIGMALIFVAVALLGFRISTWLAALGIAGHGLFDFLIHPVVVTNPGMPAWWPGFCGTIDLVIAAWLTVRLLMTAGPRKADEAAGRRS